MIQTMILATTKEAIKTCRASGLYRDLEKTGKHEAVLYIYNTLIALAFSAAKKQKTVNRRES
jgi:hypothetical protein